MRTTCYGGDMTDANTTESTTTAQQAAVAHDGQTACLLLILGFEPLPLEPEDTVVIYHRADDDRVAVVCTDGRIGTWQGGTSSRHYTPAAFTKAFARA